MLGEDPPEFGQLTSDSRSWPTRIVPERNMCSRWRPTSAGSHSTASRLCDVLTTPVERGARRIPAYRLRLGPLSCAMPSALMTSIRPASTWVRATGPSGPAMTKPAAGPRSEPASPMVAASAPRSWA